MDVVMELTRHNGRLHGTQTAHGPVGQDEAASEEKDSVQDQSTELGAAFYKQDFALDLDPEGRPIGTRSDFVRGPDGKVLWWRNRWQSCSSLMCVGGRGASEARDV